MIISLLMTVGFAQEELFSGAEWQKLRTHQKSRLLENPPLERMDQEDAADYASRAVERWGSSAASRVVSAVETVTSRHGSFSPTLLMKIADAFSDVGIDGTHAVSLTRLWERHNGAFHQVTPDLRRAGRYATVDTIYTAFRHLQGLDSFDMLEWMRTKAVIGDITGAARAACEAAGMDPRLLPLTRGQLLQLLEDAESNQRRAALMAFEECARKKDIDRQSLYAGLAEAYGRFGFYRHQTRTLRAARLDPDRTGTLLLEAAGQRMRRGLYEATIDAAAPAWELLPPGVFRKQAALLLYQCYAALDRPDSALAWIQRIDMEDSGIRGEAVALYQQLGLLEAADSLLATLEPSVMRDTLRMRQFFFSGDAQAGHRFADSSTRKARWSSLPHVRLLWRARGAVFAGTTPGTLGGLFDSTRIVPGAPGAHELLEYQYAARRLAPHASALRTWGMLRHARFAGRQARAVDRLDLQGMAPAAQQLLLETAVSSLLESDDFHRAGALIEEVAPENRSPKMRYHLAEALLRAGRMDEGRALLQELVNESSDAVYSARARMYLLELRRQPNR
jgi:thioredoxin-like negative regulator of GroEL